MLRKIFSPVFLILLLALFLRIIFLDRIPSGVSSDEMDYILNAKSVFLSGSDISHTWNPFSFTTPKNSFPQAEIAPLVTFWLIGPLPLSMSSSKLIYALISAGIVGLLFLITRKLIGKDEAVLVGIIGAVNPWLIFFGRTAYDTPLAVFFFLLAFYILLVSKNWRILISFPAFFAAFYSYIGAKLVFLPFVSITIIYSWLNNKKNLRQYGLLFGLCFILFIFYVFSVTHTAGSRVSEIANPNMSNIASMVNTERRLSIHSPLTTIFSNKYVVFGKYVLDKYLNIFAPGFLFLTGDGKSQFSLWYHGVFYYLDGIFIIIGLAILFIKKRPVFILLTLLLLIAPIASALSSVSTTYASRSLLAAPILIIFIGVGLAYVIKKYHYLRIPILIAYTILFLNFINVYFFRNPIYNSESFNFSGRKLARYLSFQTRDVFVINLNPSNPFKQYLFYNNLLNKNTSLQIAADFKNKTFSMNKSHFITCNQVKDVTQDSLVIYDNCKALKPSTNDLVIALLSDGGKILTIKNDNVCSKYKLNRYPSGIMFSDLNIEKLSEQQFCQEFITKY